MAINERRRSKKKLWRKDGDAHGRAKDRKNRRNDKMVGLKGNIEPPDENCYWRW